MAILAQAFCAQADLRARPASWVFRGPLLWRRSPPGWLIAAGGSGARRHVWPHSRPSSEPHSAARWRSSAGLVRCFAHSPACRRRPTWHGRPPGCRPWVASFCSWRSGPARSNRWGSRLLRCFRRHHPPRHAPWAPIWRPRLHHPSCDHSGAGCTLREVARTRGFVRRQVMDTLVILAQRTRCRHQLPTRSRPICPGPRRALLAMASTALSWRLLPSWWRIRCQWSASCGALPRRGCSRPAGGVVMTVQAGSSSFANGDGRWFRSAATAAAHEAGT